MKAFSLALDLVSRLVLLLAGAALVGLVAMMGWLVFGRYVLNDTPTWVERGATLTVVAIALPVAAVGVRERFHLSVLGLREALPLAAQRWIAMGCDLTVGLFGLAMAIWGYELVETVRPFNIPLLGVSQSWIYWPLVLSGGLIALFALEQIICSLGTHRGPEARGSRAALLE